MKVRSYLILFTLLGFSISCEKNKCELIVNSEILGHYCGGDSTSGSWNIVNTEVKQSTFDKTKLIIDFFPVFGEEVELTIEDCELILHPQSFEDSSYIRGVGGWIYNSRTIEGRGKFYPTDGLISIDYIMYLNDNPEPQRHHIEMYNYNKYRVSGKYLGNENTEVNIKQLNDSIILNIKCSFENQNYHWENIKGKDYGCDIYIPDQVVVDKITGETQVIYITGSKERNTIVMFINGLSETSPFDRIMFTVTKE